MFNPRMGGPGMPPPGFEEPKGFGSPLDEILMSLQRQDVPFFFMQNSHFIENQDIDAIKKGILHIAKFSFISSIIGITLNLQIK